MIVTIQLTADFICPWCYIGAARLKQAIKGLSPAIQVETVWRPFELNSALPAAGMERRAYRSRKFGSWENSQRLDAQVIEAARPDHLDFNFDRIAKTPNTLSVHRLMWLAQVEDRGKDKGTELAAALFKAYFTDGRDIGDAATLTGVAAAVGMDRERVAAFLASPEALEEIRRLEAQAHRNGIQGVPHFAIEGIAVSGAQPAATLQATIRLAARSKTTG